MRYHRHTRSPNGPETAEQSAVSFIDTHPSRNALTRHHNSIGVTRVYSQQCGYILHDAENAKHNMRAVFKLLEQSNLEPEGVNKGK